MKLEQLAKSYNVDESIDKSIFRKKARILQSIWREEMGYACGVKSSKGCSIPLGSRLQMPWSEETLSNYITETVKDVVRTEVIDAKRSEGKLYGKLRIFNDLLSSQPLCFNLFGELKHDLQLASCLVDQMTNGRFQQVTSIDFEYSPGRRNPAYTNDRSAFDVFLRCLTPSGQKGFIGIEVKYHENLQGAQGNKNSRYTEISDQMGCFVDGTKSDLEKIPIQQIWRDHLLAGVTRQNGGYADFMFIVLAPRDNYHVFNAISLYRSCLCDFSTFDYWTLEEVHQMLQNSSENASWLKAFYDRYLDFTKVEKLLM